MDTRSRRWFWGVELQRMLGIHRNTVAAWIRRGVLPPPFRVGGRFAWPVEVVEQFLRTVERPAVCVSRD